MCFRKRKQGERENSEQHRSKAHSLRPLHTAHGAPSHSSIPLKGVPRASVPGPPRGTALQPRDESRLYLQIRHISVALLRAGVVRQLHVPEAGELIHEEGVLFDDGVENILGKEARDTVKRGRGCGRSADRKWRVVPQRTPQRLHALRCLSLALPTQTGSHCGALPSPLVSRNRAKTAIALG